MAVSGICNYSGTPASAFSCGVTGCEGFTGWITCHKTFARNERVARHETVTRSKAIAGAKGGDTCDDSVICF